MPFLISAVVAAASTALCILVALISGHQHVQEFAGFLAIVGFAATLAFSFGAVTQLVPSRLGMGGWVKVLLQAAVFIVLIPMTAVVMTVVVMSVFPIVLMLLPVTRSSEDKEQEPSAADGLLALGYRMDPELMRSTDPQDAR